MIEQRSKNMNNLNITIVNIFGDTNHYPNASSIEVNDNELIIKHENDQKIQTLIGYVKEINIKTNDNYYDLFKND